MRLNTASTTESVHSVDLVEFHDGDLALRVFIEGTQMSLVMSADECARLCKLLATAGTGNPSSTRIAERMAK